VSPLQILSVALRLFAVWLGIQALRTLPSFFLVRADSASGFAYALFLFTLSAVLGLALWFFPNSIARKLLPPETSQPAPVSTVDTWLAVGCSLIGLWLVCTILPQLVLDAYFVLSSSDLDDTSRPKRWILYNLAEVLIASWLILGARGFRRVFWWVQNAGTKKAL
jgi:hypothetical protein